MSLVGLVIIRFFALATIWIILLGLLVNALGASLYSWIRWYDLHQEEHPSNAHKKIYNTYLIGGLSGTATFVNIGLLIFSLRKRVRLVAELYREAGRAVSDMPHLFCVPLLTFVALSTMSTLWLYVSIWIESSGHLTLEGTTTYYKKDAVMHIARWFNVVMAVLLLIFIVGCQDMIVACSVAHWYFVRDKTELKAPIRRSAFYLFRYHLGSVALFALSTSTFRFLRTAMKKFEYALINPKNQYIRPLFNCCDCCILFFEKYLALMSRNAYIEMSLHGKNFLTSGKEAFLLVVNNRWTMQSVSATGDYILLFLKILAVFPPVIIGTFIYQDIHAINHVWIMILLTAFLAFCISHCFISVIEMVIDTIFICYCYDIKWNDGTDKPYFMSVNLMFPLVKQCLRRMRL
uniref:Choline transporter-like protein n=1 Tax=Lygus hesperus TaxID=30085 RepID=A0A0A9WE87_LYGHE